MSDMLTLARNLAGIESLTPRQQLHAQADAVLNSLRELDAVIRQDPGLHFELYHYLDGAAKDLEQVRDWLTDEQATAQCHCREAFAFKQREDEQKEAPHA